MKERIWVTTLTHCQYLPPPSSQDAERGNRAHEYFESFSLRKEVKVEKDFGPFILVGRVDVINRFGEPVEFKSGLKFTDHIDQVKMYMNMLGVDRGWVVYKSGEVIQVLGRMPDEEIVRRYQLYKQGKLLGRCEECKLKKSCVIAFSPI
uniref:Putative nuclease n=1 Tax=Los Azufres archaeal virus 2 TaxID=1425359 RepID=A0A0A0P5W8_9VIRU|nr:putative nuclease [Los Azufres archaeal virus 2]